MALSQKTFLYEILLRFDADGFKGCHAIDLTEVRDGDEVISSKESPARGVEKDDISVLVGSQNAELVAEISRLTAENAALEGEVVALRSTLLEKYSSEAKEKDNG